MYCVNGTSRSSLLIESVDSMVGREGVRERVREGVRNGDVSNLNKELDVFLQACILLL